MSIDSSRVADTALPRTDGYWDDSSVESNLLHSPSDLDSNPVDPGQVERAGLMSLLPRFGATGIDGNESNAAERSWGETPDGKAIQIDPLHRDGDLSVAREITLADAGGGQTYVSANQLVFTTGLAVACTEGASGPGIESCEDGSGA